MVEIVSEMIKTLFGDGYTVFLKLIKSKYCLKTFTIFSKIALLLCG